jgi:hypothetical protein
MLYDDTVILLFAKAPIDGEVNTRLIPSIGVKEATKLQHDLTHQRLKTLTDAELCDVKLMCSPSVNHEFFIKCGMIYTVEPWQQASGNIGVRMHDAVKHALVDYQYCIVIGTDAPALTLEMISQAIAVLKQGVEAVFVPAEDGGYVLVGLQQAYGFIFEGIDWGTERVMQQTRNKLDAEGVTYKELATSWDIDRYEDYQRFLSLKECGALTGSGSFF